MAPVGLHVLVVGDPWRLDHSPILCVARIHNLYIDETRPGDFPAIKFNLLFIVYTFVVSIELLYFIAFRL